MDKKLFDTKSMSAFVDSTKKLKDAGAASLLRSQATAFDPKIFEVKYPSYTFMNLGVEVDTTGGVAKFIESLREDVQGHFTSTSDRSKQDGHISLSTTGQAIPVSGFKTRIEWTEEDLEVAASQGRNLPARNMSGLNEIYNKEINAIAYNGIDGNGGLINYAGFEVDADMSANIATLTGEEIYADISRLIANQSAEVNGIIEYEASRVLMPTALYKKAMSAIVNSQGSTETALQALKKNHPTVKFFMVPELTDKVIAMSVDRSAIVLRVPKPLYMVTCCAGGL